MKKVIHLLNLMIDTFIPYLWYGRINLSYREDTYMTLMLFCGSSPKILN